MKGLKNYIEKNSFTKIFFEMIFMGFFILLALAVMISIVGEESPPPPFRKSSLSNIYSAVQIAFTFGFFLLLFKLIFDVIKRIILRSGKMTEAKYIVAMEKFGLDLEYVPEEIKTKEICIAAVKDRSRAIMFVPKELKTEEIYKAALLSNKKGKEWFEYLFWFWFQ